MTISKLTYGKRDQNRVNVHLDGKFGFAIEQQTLLDYSLYQGKELSQEEIDEILQYDNVRYFTRWAREWYLRKPRSSREIRDRIVQKIKDKRLKIEETDSAQLEVDGSQVDVENVVDEVLTKLSQEGYDDASFAQWFTRQRLNQRKYGSHKVISELIGKGISQPLARQVVGALFHGEQENMVAQVLQKKFGVNSLDEIRDIKQKAKAYRYLKSRGF